MKRSMHVVLFASIVSLGLNGCDLGFQTIGASEHAVVFSGLPPMLGGGLRKKVLVPGGKEFVFPWETLYRLETSVQSVSWGGIGRGDNKEVEDHVETRALDGNEVGLAVTIQYRVNPAMVRHVVQKVSPRMDRIRFLVETVARADIRTHMNILRTRDFFDPVARQNAVDQVKTALNKRLNPEGIIVDKVIYNDHRFERRLPDNKIDRTYQEQIDKTQALSQETEQESKKRRAVVERKRQEFNEEQAKVNRRVEEAEGYKRQATLRGTAYLEAKPKNAEQVRTVGMAEVEALREQIRALSGPGGEALLRLSIAQELMKQNPSFVVINNGGEQGSGLDFNRVDTNQLLDQMGIAVAASEGARKGATVVGSELKKPTEELRSLAGEATRQSTPTE